MDLPELPVGSIYLPVTMKQFETLTNDLLNQINQLTAPDGKLDGNYMAQVVMQVIHGLDHKVGRISKTELFYGCINRISNNVTFYAVEQMRERLQAQMEANKGISSSEDIETTSPNDQTGLQLVSEDQTIEPTH